MQNRKSSNNDGDVISRAQAYLAKVPPAIEGNHGDNHTLSTACKIVRGFDLPKEAAIELLLDWNQNCQPPWTRMEIEEKVGNAIKYGTEPIRHLRDKPFNPTQSLQGSNITEKPIILDPADPVPAARTFVERFHMNGNVLALRHQGGVFYRHLGAGYQDVDEYAVRAWLYTFLEKALAWHSPKDKNKNPEPSPFKPTKSKVENLLDALRAVCNLPTSCVAPCWLEGNAKLDPYEILPCSNGLLHIPTRRLSPPSARFFTLSGLNFEYSPAAARPENWLSFLDELWPDDPQSHQTLQEWIGYLLTPRTNQQKICMLIGPKRSGKGTIGRVTRMLLGDRNVCGPTLSNMGEQFGLSVLVGKSAAIIADARIGGKADSAVVAERLLSISGEDLQTIPRKFLPDWNGKLPIRFTILTNELPGIEDSSGALASRFLILTLTKSFFGREDHNLLDRFIPELPGILLWALEGWDRLSRRGRFVQPPSSEQLIQTFEDLGSPISAFAREICEMGPGFEALQASLFQEWKSWCESTGRRPGTTQAFARNLRAAFPWLTVERPRVDGDQLRFWQGIRIRSKQC